MEDVDDGRGFERYTADGRSVLKARMMKSRVAVIIYTMMRSRSIRELSGECVMKIEKSEKCVNQPTGSESERCRRSSWR